MATRTRFHDWSARVLNQNLCIFETIRANILRVNKKLRQLYGSEQNCKRVYSSSPKYACASSNSVRVFASTLQTCSFVYLQSVVVTEHSISRWRPLRCFGLNVKDESTDGNFALFTQVLNLEAYPRFRGIQRSGFVRKLIHMMRLRHISMGIFATSFDPDRHPRGRLGSSLNSNLERTRSVGVRLGTICRGSRTSTTG